MIDLRENIRLVHRELDWLSEVIHQGIASYLLHEGHEKSWEDIPLPELSELDGPYAAFIVKHNFGRIERFILALTIAPHLRPNTLDIFFGKNKQFDRGFTEFGGYIGNEHNGFIPTIQTALFVTSSTNKRFHQEILAVFSATSVLIQQQVIGLQGNSRQFSDYTTIIYLENRWMDYFLTGELKPLSHSVNFPAHPITTKLDWGDLVLDEGLLDQLKDIEVWAKYGPSLMEIKGFSRKVKPGYRALFYGPPGTGKTLMASLLGKNTNKPVYRVDLSMISSKYIGETEKNLAKIFDIAQHQDWILFFDEADSLFGKRTAASSSNDRHANQQTGYLLQRIEDFPGLIILASNLKENIDQAFMRRFQSIIHFKMPDPEERYLLWKKTFDQACELEQDVDLYEIAEQYKLAGGSIINVLRYCIIQKTKEKTEKVSKNQLIKGLKRELAKEHKTLSTY